MIQYDIFLVDVNDYNELKTYPPGRFGTVKIAEKEKQKYVIRDFNQNPEINKLILREVEVLSNIRSHPAICRFYGYSLAPFQMVFEYLPNGSLQDIFDKLKNKTKVSQWNGTMKSKTIFGVACALHHLHNHDIFHRFLTPSCILFDENNEPRLTDFIYSRRNEDSTKFTIINDDKSPYYQAPEIHTEEYDKPVDYFSYGMILYHIVSGKQPYESKGYIAIKEIMDNKRPEIPDDCDKRLKLLISDLWKHNPNDRPQFIDVIKALKNYDNPLFPDTDMPEYKKYRERLLQTTYFTEQDFSFLNAPSYSKQDEENFDKTLIKAEKNDVPSMMKIARMFELGIGTDISLVDAIEWYQRAADLNDPEALYKIANFYLTNNDILQPNEQKYIEYLKKSCKLGFNTAISDYAHILSIGSGVTQNIPEAIKMLKSLADPPKNDKEAQYRLARLYESIGEEKDSRKYYNMCIKQNYLPARADNALYLLEKNEYAEGMKELKKAAQDGWPMANANLGKIYEKGKYGQKKNLKDAISYHIIGEKNGCSASMVVLGKAYFNGKFGGEDFEKDEFRAARLFERAAELNDPEGLYSWAIFELKGIGGTKININDALSDLKVSASFGFAPAMFKLYQLLTEGINGIRDSNAAQDFLNQACSMGYQKAIQERDGTK